MSRTKTYGYTLDDRVSSIDYSDSGTADVTFSYDASFARTATRTDGAGTTKFFYHPYDGSTLGAGQLWKVNGPFTDDTLKYTHDELGRVRKWEIVDDATATTVTSSEAYTFDSRGRVVGVENNLGSFDYSYVGQSSRVDAVDYPNGMEVSYDYFGTTGDHLLKQIKNLSSGGSPSVISQFDYAYNPDRTIKTWRIQQGTETSTWTFSYDPSNQLVGAVRADGSTALESEQYGYDLARNRVQVVTGTTTSPAVRNFAVNNLNQLRSERGFGKTTVAGTVDEAATVTVNGAPARVFSTSGGAPYRFEAEVVLASGSNTITVQAKDGNNNTRTNTYQVTATGTTTLYEYDGNGNLRYEREPNQSVRREFQWDQENRLTKVIDGTHESRFEYDGAAQRTRIKEYVNSTETSDKVFIWCGARICQMRSGSTIERRYFSTGFQASTTKYFYTSDRLGSIWEVVEDDGSTLDSRKRYGPWGHTEPIGGSGAESSFGFTRHYADAPNDIALAQYRGYDSATARWLSRDPLGTVGGPNLYTYVSNRPTALVDPSGAIEVDFPWGDPRPDRPRRPTCGDVPPPKPPPPDPCPDRKVTYHGTCEGKGTPEWPKEVDWGRKQCEPHVPSKCELTGVECRPPDPPDPSNPYDPGSVDNNLWCVFE